MSELKPNEMLQPTDVAQTVSFAVKESRRSTSCISEIRLDSQLPLFRHNKESVAHELAHVEGILHDISTPSIREDVALVTGGSRGIGKASALALAQGGIKKIALIARDVDTLRATAHDIERLVPGTACLPLAADLTDAQAAARAVSNCIEQFDGISILVHSAGVNRRRSVISSDPSVWDEVYSARTRTQEHFIINILGHILESKTGSRRHA